jgi:hypothetical protein
MLRTLTFILLSIASISIWGQSNDLQQRIHGFQTDLKEGYVVKTLNLNGENLGALEAEETATRTHFKMEAREKTEDNLGRSVKRSVHVQVFSFESIDDLNWAMKRWLPDFIDHSAVRPGRDVKNVPNVDPSVVVIEGTSIAVLTQSCSQFDLESFRDWRQRMLTYFGSAAAVVIEVQGCEGPLMWTKNAPDPKDRTWK